MAAAVGSGANFFIYKNNALVSSPHTLVKQTLLSPIPGSTTPVRISYWVESSEWGPGKVTQSMIDGFDAQMSVGGSVPAIFPSVERLTGSVWGPVPASLQPFLIPGAGGASAPEDFQVLISNITPDGAPYGILGYFDGSNNMRASQSAQSNERLMITLDSETLYLDPTSGKQSILSAFAHEMTHAANFYQRGVLHGLSMTSAAEETLAMMTEDV